MHLINTTPPIIDQLQGHINSCLKNDVKKILTSSLTTAYQIHY